MSKEEIIEAVKAMTVVELSELVKAIEEEFGVSAVAAAAPAAAGAAAAEEKTSFNVVLKEAGDQKIKVITVVKNALGLGLKDANQCQLHSPYPRCTAAQGRPERSRPVPVSGQRLCCARL